MEAQRKTVLVLGANGRFGASAVQAFAAAGWRVLAQARRAPVVALPGGAEPLRMPLDDAAALAAAASGANVVVHAVNPPYTRWSQDVLPLGRRCMEVAQRLDARLMLPGNVYNFGASMPAVLREDTPQRPSAAKGSLRCALEAEMQARAAQGLRSVVIRAGDFYGSGSGSWLDLVILKSLKKGKLVYPGPLDVPHAWAYLPDLARAFVAVAERGDARPFARWHFAGQTLTGAQLLAALEQAAGSLGLARPPGGWRHGGVSWPMLRALGLVVPIVREVARMSYLWQVPHALDGSALAAAVGPLPATTLDVALRTALRDLGLGVDDVRSPLAKPSDSPAPLPRT
jgi:nucleoside-diphosphate-sugar epimerase